MDGRLVGIIRVPVCHLSFREDLAAREYDPNISGYLKPKIRHDPQQDNCRNRVEGIIDSARLTLVLADLGFPSEEPLNQTIQSGEYPCVPNQSIEYIHGRHRVEAAKTALGEDTLWTVELRWFRDLGYLYLSQNAYITNKAEQYAHETPYSPGEKYLKIRQYQDAHDRFRETKWRHRLTKGENIAVRMIQQRKDICDVLDQLRPFKGLWSGMNLGIYRRHFALDCDKEILRYLHHIYHIWSNITSGNPTIQIYVDINTVRKLERRAPSVSDQDRELIEKAFEQGKIFAEVQTLKYDH